MESGQVEKLVIGRQNVMRLLLRLMKKIAKGIGRDFTASSVPREMVSTYNYTCTSN